MADDAEFHLIKINFAPAPDRHRLHKETSWAYSINYLNVIKRSVQKQALREAEEGK